MLSKKEYENGQRVYEIDGELLTYFFANGVKKSEGQYIDQLMEGEWLFYRETGQLWEIGNFLHNEKHGNWKRWSEEDELIADDNYDNGQLIKK